MFRKLWVKFVANKSPLKKFHSFCRIFIMFSPLGLTSFLNGLKSCGDAVYINMMAKRAKYFKRKHSLNLMILLVYFHLYLLNGVKNHMRQWTRFNLQEVSRSSNILSILSTFSFRLIRFVF